MGIFRAGHSFKLDALLIVLALTVVLSLPAQAVNVTWIGVGAEWIDNAGDANWSPADEPDTNDTAIFNSSSGGVVRMGTSNSILAMTLSNGAGVLTNGHDLTVNGLIQINGGSTRVVVEENSVVAADDVTVSTGGAFRLAGGTLIVDDETGNGVFDVNVNSQIAGWGTINFTDALGVASTLLINDGGIIANRTDITPPPPSTLLIDSTSPLARIDIDGAANAGGLTVLRNMTLDIDLAIADVMNGPISMTHNATLDIAGPWSFAGTMNIDNGFILGSPPFPDVPADVAYLKGGTITQTAGTINLMRPDGTLQFDTVFNMNDGNFVANGHVIFNNNATIAAAANFTRPTGTSNITVGAGRTLTINQANFDLDGQANTTSFITVNAGGQVVANLGDYDPDSAVNDYSSTINLNNGVMTVNMGDAEFVMNGTLNMHSDVAGQPAVWSGEPIDIGNDSGTHDARLNVTGNQASTITAPIDFNSDADVDIASGAKLILTNIVNFDSVNGANNGRFAGAGELVFNGAVNVNEAVTLDFAGGAVDLDGSDTVGDVVNVDAALTVNAATFSSFGRVNSGGGTNIIDIDNLTAGRLGSLTVNLDDPAAEWTLNPLGVMNLVNDGTTATLLSGSDVNLNGTVNVTGDVRLDARVDVGGTVTIAAGGKIRFAGGDGVVDPNRLEGGTINGPGRVGAEAGESLHGHGTINAPIDFSGVADLRARGGTLTINGPMLSVGVIGTAHSSGVLNIVNAWETGGGPGGTIGGVNLTGGVLQGGQITNDNPLGIMGFGTVSARVVNNSRIGGFFGGTLIVETANNDNDWDGTTNTGELATIGGNLELRDNATFPFLGTVTANDGDEVFASGFALEFEPGSTIALSNGGTYRTTGSTLIGGSITVGTGITSEIEVPVGQSLTLEASSTTVLNGSLRLVNDDIEIEAGSAFTGDGELIIPVGSTLGSADEASIGVLLDLQGAFYPGGLDEIGQVSLAGYRQVSSGELFVELAGTQASMFDSLSVAEAVELDGYLSIEIAESFIPVEGDAFELITAENITGQFDLVEVTGLPEGLEFNIEYLSDAVTLQFVDPSLPGDFDNDGDVDGRDFLMWQRNPAVGNLADWQANYGAGGLGIFSTSPAAADSLDTGASPVPEPSTFVLALLGVCLLSRERSNKRRQ
jgi:hypothetical protein